MKAHREKRRHRGTSARWDPARLGRKGTAELRLEGSLKLKAEAIAAARIAGISLETKDAGALVVGGTGRRVHLRVARISGSLPEHRIGLHRFSWSGAAAKSDFCVFGLFAPQAATYYVFRSGEIASVKSLNLRFAMFHRKSKYDYGRGRWRLLLGRNSRS